MATWYRTGTVSVTNGIATVTGSGTTWVGNVEPGYGLLINGDIYEIEDVVSNTEIGLATDYIGGTLSGQAYAIIPTKGILLALANRFADLQALYEAGIDGPLSGRFPAGSVGTPSIAGESDIDTGLRIPGDETLEAITNGIQRILLSTSAMQVDVPITGTAVQSSDIDTTITRLMRVGAFGLGSIISPTLSDIDTDPLVNRRGWWRILGTTTGTLPPNGSAKGGGLTFGYDADDWASLYADHQRHKYWLRTCEDGAIGDWEQVYTQRSAVGTVSQADGVPTGALQEGGSAANGYFWRFANGLQICKHLVTLDYSSAARLQDIWYFPAQFVAGETPAVVGSMITDTISATPDVSEMSDVRVGNVDNASSAVRLHRLFGMTDFQAADTMDVWMTATGRWY